MVATAGETPVRVTVPSASGSGIEIDNVRSSFVSGNYFSVLGSTPPRDGCSWPMTTDSRTAPRRPAPSSC